MASPQTENGHTRIANELLEKLVTVDYTSASTMRVLMYLYRCSYGYSKKSCTLSITRVQNQVGISKNCVINSLQWLVGCGMIIKGKSSQDGTIYEIQKDYDKWVVLQRGSPTARYTTPQVQGSPTASTTVVLQRAPIKTNSKTNLKEKEKSRFTPPSPKEVNEYCQSIGYSVDGEAFCGFYESNGWKVGKNPMKSWKGAVATWEKRNNPTKKETPIERFKKLRSSIMRNFTDMREAHHGSTIEGYDIHHIDDEIDMLSGGVWTLTPEVEKALNSPDLFKKMEAKLYELTTRNNRIEVH